MRDYQEGLKSFTSKSAMERHAILKRIRAKHSFKLLMKSMDIKIKNTPKSQINSIRILKSDLKWARKTLSKPKK